MDFTCCYWSNRSLHVVIVMYTLFFKGKLILLMLMAGHNSLFLLLSLHALFISDHIQCKGLKSPWFLWFTNPSPDFFFFPSNSKRCPASVTYRQNVSFSIMWQTNEPNFQCIYFPVCGTINTTIPLQNTVVCSYPWFCSSYIFKRSLNYNTLWCNNLKENPPPSKKKMEICVSNYKFLF